MIGAMYDRHTWNAGTYLLVKANSFEAGTGY